MIGIGKAIILFMLSYGVMCDAELPNPNDIKGTDAAAAPCPAGYDRVFTDDTGRRINILGNNMIIDGQIISINDGMISRSEDGTAVEFRKPKGGTAKGKLTCMVKAY